MMTWPGPLADLVAAWLPAQRWFAGKGRPFRIDGMDVVGDLTVQPYRSAIWLVWVHYAGGGVETYQIPLVERPAPVGELAHALLGELADTRTGKLSWWYDALHDSEVAGAWLGHLAAATSQVSVSFHRGPGIRTLPVGAPSLVSTAEQSNTSLVFGDQVILKVFRRVAPGLSPDIEVHEALARRGTGRHVARLLGHVTARWAEHGQTRDDGVPVAGSLALAEEFFRSGVDGWELARTSVRDLYAEADRPPDEVGGDFAAEAFRLGAAAAEVHADLARALPTTVWDRGEVHRLAERMRERMDASVRVVAQLAEHVDGLSAIYDALAAYPARVAAQRIHGDLHLGQVLRTVDGWVLLDFEGEPARPLAERVRLDSPLRDVAGMLRSFDYAARHLLADHPEQPGLTRRAEEWADRNRSAFCAGYAETSGADPRQDSVLLRAYEADKAVYEAMYEARNRPGWLGVPLSSLARLTATADG
jgi:maltokinase